MASIESSAVDLSKGLQGIAFAAERVQRWANLLLQDASAGRIGGHDHKAREPFDEDVAGDLSPPPKDVHDIDLVTRIMKAHRLAEPGVGPLMQESIWDDLFRARLSSIDETLRGESDEAVEAAARLLRSPASNDLLYGVENLTKLIVDSVRLSGPLGSAKTTFAALTNLARAMGETNLPISNSPTMALLNNLDHGWNSPFPVANPFADEFGLLTVRGVVSENAAMAAYLAWRAGELLHGISRPQVAEIGGGLGRVAYYLAGRVELDYCAVELPLQRAAQAYYLGRVLGARAIRLAHETDRLDAWAEIIGPAQFLESEARYDLVIAQDTFSVIPDQVLDLYFASLARRAKHLLIVDNADADERIEATSRRHGARLIRRYPHWLRKTGSERVVTF